MLPKVPDFTAAAAIAGWMPADIRIGMKIAPTAAEHPAALGNAILMTKVIIVVPGIKSGLTFFKTPAKRQMRCLSQVVYFITRAKPITEQTEVINPPETISLAKASSAVIGLPASAAIKIPAPIRTSLES